MNREDELQGIIDFQTKEIKELMEERDRLLRRINTRDEERGLPNSLILEE